MGNFSKRCISLRPAIAIIALLICGVFAATVPAATPSANSPPRIPRIIRLIKSAPYAYAFMTERLRIQQRAGSPEFAFSSWADNRIVGARRDIPSADMRNPAMHASFMQYARGTSAAIYRTEESFREYAGAVGAARSLFLFNTHFVSTVFVVSGRAEKKSPASPDLPSWLNVRLREGIQDWINLGYPITSPTMASGRGLLTGLQNCNNYIVSSNPFQIQCLDTASQAGLRLRFGQWKHGQGVPWLESYHLWCRKKVHGFTVATDMTVRAGSLADPMPVHLSAAGLKKLGFTIVRLKADTPAPEINILTRAQRERMRIMRKRFEQWAGAWHQPMSHASPKAKKE